jgi:hypothetical protein
MPTGFNLQQVVCNSAECGGITDAYTSDDKPSKRSLNMYNKLVLLNVALLVTFTVWCGAMIALLPYITK